jgi:hypothetical protein
MERDFPREEGKNLVAPCGLFCGSCEMYRCKAMGDIEGQKRLGTDFQCMGCRKDFNNCWSNDCKIYLCCVKEKKQDFYYECDDFPCNRVKPYRARQTEELLKDCGPDQNLRVYNLLIIKKMGWREWLKKEKQDVREHRQRY